MDKMGLLDYRICMRCKKDLCLPGIHHGLRYYDEKGNWDGKSFLCPKCSIYVKRHGRQTDEEKRKERLEYFAEKGNYEINKEHKCKVCGDTNLYAKCMCRSCYRKDYYINKEKVDPNSQVKIMKSLAHFRTGQIDKYDKRGKGLIHEFVIMKIRKIKNYNIESDNFNSKYDLLTDSEYGIIQVKGRKLYCGGWKTKIGREHHFDVLFLLCKSKDGEDIQRIYIIPESEFYGIGGLEIPKSPKLSIGSKWEKFRLDDVTAKIYNDTYHAVMLHLKDEKYFGIKDLEEWLNKEK